MMPSNADKELLNELIGKLMGYSDRALVGLISPAHTGALAQQMLDSVRRVKYARHLQNADHSPSRSDPQSTLFDPLKAAVLSNRAGDVDNAYWLVFLATHFGKHKIDGWRLTKDIYGRMGSAPFWTWKEVSENLPGFVKWAADARLAMKADGLARRFSNHRKYESLDHIGSVVESYVGWVLPFGSHSEMIKAIHRQVGQNPRDTFARMYYDMAQVRRFGRLAKFDYLAMLGKLGISPIEPGSPFLAGATGPLGGARLLFGRPTLPAATADQWTIDLGAHLGLGMQIMEDSICNWQKSPAIYKRFSG